MKRGLLLLTLALLPGCDVATAALILGAQDKGSSDDAPLAAPGPGFGSPVFQAWIASIADPNTAHAELVQSGGNPPTSWTLIGNAAATYIFDPSADPASFNAILIQVSSDQNYRLDSVEILDSQNAAIEHASGTTYSNLVNSADQLLGPPDGSAAVTAATGTARAFIFTLYSGPIDRFRINAGGDAQPVTPGDVKAVGSFQSLLSERPGGVAIDGNGRVHLTLSVGDTGRLVRYNLAGVMQDDVEISTDLAAAGSHAVALNSTGVIFTAASIGTGVIQVRRFESDLSAGNIAGFSSGINGDRVEHNGITIDGSGNVVIAGGFSSLTSGRNHFRAKMPDTLTGTTWQYSSSLDNSSISYWHAVATGANDEIFMTGDLRANILSQTHQIYTGIFNPAGGAIWEDEHFEGEAPDDVGHAIALDAAGNIYVGGGVGTDSDGRDGVLLRYPVGGGAPVDVEFSGLAGLNDEILDVAVDSDGAVYAVGYETVAGQGENWWVRKYVFNSLFNSFTTVWARTHHGGFGNDRAVGVSVFGSDVVVAGFETNASSQTKLVLRIYEK